MLKNSRNLFIRTSMPKNLNIVERTNPKGHLSAFFRIFNHSESTTSNPEFGRVGTLIKKKIKFSSYIRKLRGIGCKVIYG
jgi:hypothetical protein